MEAEEIVPRSKVFHYAAGEFNRGSIAGFSNLFLYNLIYQRGGWWVDVDHCCLQRFPDDVEEAFFRAPANDCPFRVAAGIFKAPAGSEVLRRCLALFAQKDVSRLVHGETGPELITKVIMRLGQESRVQPGERYLPVPWWEYQRLFFDEELSVDGCFTLHFYNAMLGSIGLDKDAQYPAGSVFETLKRRYLGSAGCERGQSTL